MSNLTKEEILENYNTFIEYNQKDPYTDSISHDGCIKNQGNFDINHREDDAINQLRNLRNEFNNMASNCQRKIDEIILDKNNFLQYARKYVRVYDGTSTLYLYVHHIGRTYKGCYLIGNSFEYTVQSGLHINVDDKVSWNLDTNLKVDIITKDEYYSELERAINSIKHDFSTWENTPV